MLTEEHEAPTERTEIKVGHDAQHCVWILAETKDGQTVRVRYTNKEALNHASNVVDAVNIVHRANALREYEIRQLATMPPDPRPSDMAELAKLVAIELRKRGICATTTHQDFGPCVAVPTFGSRTDGDGLKWRFHTMLHLDFDNLGPIGCAGEIQRQEVARAQEWAGDK